MHERLKVCCRIFLTVNYGEKLVGSLLGWWTCFKKPLDSRVEHALAPSKFNCCFNQNMYHSVRWWFVPNTDRCFIIIINERIGKYWKYFFESSSSWKFFPRNGSCNAFNACSHSVSTCCWWFRFFFFIYNKVF